MDIFPRLDQWESEQNFCFNCEEREIPIQIFCWTDCQHFWDLYSLSSILPLRWKGLLGTEPTMQNILHFLHGRQFLYHWATWEAHVSLCIVSFSIANGLGGSENATGESWTCIFQFWAGGKCFQFPITKIIGQYSNWWVWILWPPLEPNTETKPER